MTSSRRLADLLELTENHEQVQQGSSCYPAEVGWVAAGGLNFTHHELSVYDLHIYGTYTCKDDFSLNAQHKPSGEHEPAGLICCGSRADDLAETLGSTFALHSQSKGRLVRTLSPSTAPWKKDSCLRVPTITPFAFSLNVWHERPKPLIGCCGCKLSVQKPIKISWL